MASKRSAVVCEMWQGRVNRFSLVSLLSWVAIACGADPQVEPVNGDAEDVAQVNDVTATTDTQVQQIDLGGQQADADAAGPDGDGAQTDIIPRKPDGFLDPPDGKPDKPDGFADPHDGKGQKPDGLLEPPDGKDEKPDGFPDPPDGKDGKPDGLPDPPDAGLDSADGLLDPPDEQAPDAAADGVPDKDLKIGDILAAPDAVSGPQDAADSLAGSEVDSPPDASASVDAESEDDASNSSDISAPDAPLGDAPLTECIAASDCAKKPPLPCQIWICQAFVCVTAAVADGTPCDDDDACSVAETCSAGKCAQGLAKNCDDGNACTIDGCEANSGGCLFTPVKTPCDDGNVCTKEGCEPLAGCVAVAVDDGKTCDDGNTCTAKEVCGGGVCKGGLALDCDDGKFCTNDVCEPKTGNCNWTAKFGGCDDGDACTSNDACKTGNCKGDLKACDDKNACTTDSCSQGNCTYLAIPPGVSVKCDDGNPCTDGDACKGQVCGGIPIDLKGCDDGNACTADGCDSKTGACTHNAKAGPCDDGNFCTSGDICDIKGFCTAGNKSTCDDGNFCTADACSAAQGKCSSAKVGDGILCDDGIACTDASACKNGLCAPTKGNCTLLSDSFECVDGGNGWNLPKPFGYQVLWAVDQTPILPQQQKYQCTLNYNNGLNYCDFPLGGNLCLGTPNVTATSALIDASSKAGVPRIRFDTFYELDGPKPGGTGFGEAKTDVPLVVLREEGTKIILDQFLLSKSSNNCGGPCQGIWRAIDVEVPKVSGKSFRVEFSLQAPNNQGNSGRGWFVDNLKIQLDFSAEECGNALDDDGNGKVDCQDPACIGQPGC